MHSVLGHMRLVVAAAGPHMLVAMLLPKGLLMWSVMLARGPLPVAWACSVNPAPQRPTDSVGTATTTARRLQEWACCGCTVGFTPGRR